MKTKNNKKSTKSNNTETEARFVGTNWDIPEVTLRKQGAGHRTLKRKVITTGIYDVGLNDDTLAEIKVALRQGKEVRINGMIRLFPCMDKELSQMFVAAQTMNPLRNLLADKKAKVTHCKKEVDVEEMLEVANERHERYMAERNEVTPDILVTCPKCGHKFRVGRKIGK